MDLETLTTQAIEQSGSLERTSVMLRTDQIEAIQELAGAPRTRGGRSWSNMTRKALDIGIAFIKEGKSAAPRVKATKAAKH